MREHDKHKDHQHKSATAGPSADDRYGAGVVATNLESRILAIHVVDGRTRLTIARGKNWGVQPAMEGYVKAGLSMLADFQIDEVDLFRCHAFVDLTPDQLKTEQLVVINPTSKPGQNVPAGTSARVIGVWVEGGRTKIIISRGFAHGVRFRATGELHSADGQVGPSFVIDGVTATQSFALVNDTVDKVNAHKTVVLHGLQKPNAPIQRRATGSSSTADVQTAANAGVASASSALPHLDTIQRSFGKHDVSGIRAQVGGNATSATAALGAEAYATGDRVAFASAPNLHTAAHEAAHVIQQQRGAVGFQGLGAADDEHERHADAVADAVVAGNSAESLLDQISGTGSVGAVQRKPARPYEAFELPSTRRETIDWRMRIRAQALPYEYREVPCILDEKVPERRLGTLSSRAHDPGDGQDVLEDAKAWTAIRSVTREAHDLHRGVGAAVTTYRNAQSDPDLAALLFLIPPQQQGDLDHYAEQQRLPDRGGPHVGALFDRSSAVQNEAIVSKLQANGGAPHDRTDDAAAATTASGSELHAAILGVKGSIEGVASARAELDGALHQVAAEKAANQAADVRAEIEMLKEEAATFKEGFEAAFVFLAGAAHVLAGEVGDLIDKVGVLAGTLMGHLNDRQIRDLEKMLATSERTVRTERGKALASQVDAKKSALLQAVLEVEARKAKLRTAYVARRTSYTQLGRAAASELDGTQEQKQRLAALLAAVPIVELVVARTRDIVQQCTRVPQYSEAAGDGFALATRHQPNKAALFLTALNEIEGTRQIYARAQSRWEQRLAQLSRVERETIGARPGGGR